MAKRALTKTAPAPKVLNNVSRPVVRILEQRPLITGEEPADYDDLLDRFIATVKPKDAIEWVWLKDVVDLVWDVQRLRRLRTALLVTARITAMARILRPLMELDVFNTLEVFGQDAVAKTANGWARGETKAVQKAEELLSEHGLSIDAVIANAFVRHMGALESIERMMATAEIRRDRILNEIEKRRDAIAWRLREAASNVIDVEGDPPPVAATS